MGTKRLKANIEKEKAIIDAKAQAETKVELANGEATATLARYKAQAEGLEELLNSQAAGFKKLVEAAGGDAQSAIGYLMIDKLTDIAKIQVDAIKDLKIDKVVVYDNGSGEGMGNFVQGLYGMLPQLNDFLEQSGMSLPKGLVNLKGEEPKIPLKPVQQIDKEE